MKKYFSLKSLFRGAISLQMALGAQVLTVNSRAWAQATPEQENYTRSYSEFRNSRKLEKLEPKSEPQNPPMTQEMMDYQRHMVDAYGIQQRVDYTTDKNAVNLVMKNFHEQEVNANMSMLNPYEQMESKQISETKNKMPKVGFGEAYNLLIRARMGKFDGVRFEEDHAILFKKPKNITEAMESSPRRLKQKMAASAKALGGKVGQYTYIWPVEAVKMGLVIGAMTYYKVMTDLASDPAGIERFIDGQMDPITQFGLLAFIVGNHETQAMLFKNKQMNGRLTRLMAVQTIPYMSMSVGMMAQTLVAEIAHDKDLQTCAKGYAGYSGISEDERDNACDKTLENWYYEGRRNKIDSWTPSLISMLAATEAAAKGQRALGRGFIGITQGVDEASIAGRALAKSRGVAMFITGIEVGATVSTSGISIVLGTLVNGMIQFAAFSYLDEHFFHRPVTRAYQTLVKGLDVDSSSKNIVANLLNKKVNQWQRDQGPNVCRGVRGASDEENCTVDADGKKFCRAVVGGSAEEGCYLDLHDELKKFSKYSSVFRQVQQTEFYEAFGSWQSFVQKMNTQYTVTEALYGLFVSMIFDQNRYLYQPGLIPSYLLTPKVKISDLNPLAGIRYTLDPSNPGSRPIGPLEHGPNYKSGQRRTLVNALKKYNLTSLDKEVGFSNLNHMMVQRLKKDFGLLSKKINFTNSIATEVVLNDDNSIGNAINDIRYIVYEKDSQQGNDPKLYSFLGNFLRYLGNPIPAFQPGLWWWGDFLRYVSTSDAQSAALDKALNENLDQNNHEKLSYADVKKTTMDPENLSKSGQSGLSQSRTTMEILNSAKEHFNKTYGIFKTPTPAEYYLVSMICGPDLLKPEQANEIIDDQRGYYTRFKPFRLAYSKDDFGSTCSDIGPGAGLYNVYETPIYFTRDGKRYKEDNILVYLSKHIDPQYFGDTKNDTGPRYSSAKIWEKYVQTRYQKWLQKYNVYYKDVVIKGVRNFLGISKNFLGTSGNKYDAKEIAKEGEKGRFFNHSDMSLRPIESLIQERRLSLMILNEMLKDQIIKRSAEKGFSLEKVLQEQYSFLPQDQKTKNWYINPNAHFHVKPIQTRDEFIDQFRLLTMLKLSPTLDLASIVSPINAPFIQPKLGPMLNGHHKIVQQIEGQFEDLDKAIISSEIIIKNGREEIKAGMKFDELSKLLAKLQQSLAMYKVALFGVAMDGSIANDLRKYDMDYTMSRAYGFNNYQLDIGNIIFDNLQKNAEEMGQFLNMQVFMDYENRSKIDDLVSSTLDKVQNAKSQQQKNFGR